MTRQLIKLLIKKKGTEKVIGTGRKKFLVALLKTANTPSTSFHKYVKSLDGYIDVENLRDGFYKANNYEQNDVMLVLKPTGLISQFKSLHLLY